MNTVTREDVRSTAEAWRHLPEGATAAPMFSLPVTPAALLLIMETFRMDSIEATLIWPEPPTGTDDMSPPDEGFRAAPSVYPTPGGERSRHPFVRGVETTTGPICAEPFCGAAPNAGVHQPGPVPA